MEASRCPQVGQASMQKILRNGRSVTIFTVGTGGMFDQRISEAKDLPKPAAWHRVAVHNKCWGLCSSTTCEKFMLRVKLKPASTMTVSTVKFKAFQNYVCAVMEEFS